MEQIQASAVAPAKQVCGVWSLVEFSMLLWARSKQQKWHRGEGGASVRCSVVRRADPAMSDVLEMEI